MFPQNFNLFKSIQQQQIPLSNNDLGFQMIIPGLSNNSTSTAISAPLSNNSWVSPQAVFVNEHSNEAQPQFETNGLHAVSNTTNTNLGNSLSILNNEQLDTLTKLLSRNRSQSVGAIPNGFNFSPQLSSFVSNTSNTNQTMTSTSLPNNMTIYTLNQPKPAPSTQQPQEFGQPYFIQSDYQVSSTPDENMTQAINNFFQPNNSLFGFDEQQQTIQQENFPFLINSPLVSNNQSNNSIPILNISQPTSPNQQLNHPLRGGFSPNSNSPTSNSMNQSMSQPIVISNVNGQSGKIRKKRSISNASASSNSSSSQPYPNNHFESPKKSNKKSNSIKFQLDFLNNAQKFDIKHTSFTPSTMRMQIAAKDERERNGSKRRGRPKGSGVKPAEKRDVLFYQNCFNSVENLYKGRDPHSREDDDQDGDDLTC